MNPVPLFLIIVTLPLLLGGCSIEEPVTETKLELEGVNAEKLEEREGLAYVKGSDAPYTGKVYGLYENGQKKAEANFKDGKPNGVMVLWHDNGQKSYEANFKDGKRDGLWLTWHDNGQKNDEGNWKDGKMDGLHVKWYSNGKKNQEVNYKDGKTNGLLALWHDNGQKSYEANFKDGKRISEKWWDIKGEPVPRQEAEAE